MGASFLMAGKGDQKAAAYFDKGFSLYSPGEQAMPLKAGVRGQRPRRRPASLRGQIKPPPPLSAGRTKSPGNARGSLHRFPTRSYFTRLRYRS